MDKFLKTLLLPILFFTFLCFSNTNKAAALTSNQVKEGDILISNQTQCYLNTCAKITGHAGIVVNANGGLKVLHIHGKTSGLEQIKINSVSTFFSNYNQKIKVVRSNSSTTAKNAAKQALKYFANLSSGKYTGKKLNI